MRKRKVKQGRSSRCEDFLIKACNLSTSNGILTPPVCRYELIIHIPVVFAFRLGSSNNYTTAGFPGFFPLNILDTF